jgi:DNA-binding transcriptional ArsR family regulator
MRPLAQAAIDQFAALGDPTRVRVVEMLSEKSRPVHELAGAFDISRPAISRHLRVLKEAGLVKEEKQGRENVYTLQRARLKSLLDWLERHRAAPAKAAKAKPAPSAKPPRKAPVAAVTPPPAAPAAPQIAFDF